MRSHTVLPYVPCTVILEGGEDKSITYECCSEVESEHKQSSYRAQPLVFPFTDGPQTNVYSQEYKITKSERVKQDRPLVGACP